MEILDTEVREETVLAMGFYVRAGGFGGGPIPYHVSEEIGSLRPPEAGDGRLFNLMMV